MSRISFVSDEAEYTYWNTCLDSCNTEDVSCDNKCRARMSTMRFMSSSEQRQYY